FSAIIQFDAVHLSPDPEGSQRTIIPEPASLSMLMLGVLGFLGTQRRKTSILAV
ncbi:MAG: PEP-CTERM sorting domain-containing protein, partial [Methyloprofundus sp.]|nr:PEP-CTERM sorting domain-containing protein [Methyloprofundus sp.]